MSLKEDTDEGLGCICHQIAQTQNDSSFEEVCESIIASFEKLQEALNKTNCSYGDYETYVEPWPYPEHIVMSVLFSILMVAGLIGNILVIYVVVKHGIKRSITNLYFISLAVADFIYLLFCIPLTIAIFVLPYWPFGQVTCKCQPSCFFSFFFFFFVACLLLEYLMLKTKTIPFHLNFIIISSITHLATSINTANQQCRECISQI